MSSLSVDIFTVSSKRSQKLLVGVDENMYVFWVGLAIPLFFNLILSALLVLMA